MPVEEAILTGTARLGVDSRQNLTGRAWLLATQPDVLVDGDGWIPDHAIRDGDDGYIVLGIWKPGELAGYVELDLSVVNAALPRLGTREQIGGLEVWVGDARLDTLPGISVSRALGQPSTFSFAVPYKKRNPLRPTVVTRPLPGLVGALGNPLGLSIVEIKAAYLTDTGPARVVLVRGRAHTADLASGVYTISGGDHWATMENRIEAGFSIPAGSGLPRGMVAQDLATNGHGWTCSFWSGTPMYRGYEAVNEPVMQKVAEIADADNRLLFVLPDSTLTALPEVDTTSPIVMSLTARDLLAADLPVMSGPGANPPTQIEIGGTQQVLRDNAGRRTIESVSKAWAPYAVQAALAVQDSAGNVDPIPGATAEESELQKVGETKTKRTYEGDTLVVEEVRSKAWYNPQIWRYELVTDEDGVDGGGDFQSYNPSAYFYDAGATKNDATPTYRWHRERFTDIGGQITSHTYDARNFLTETEIVKEGWLLLQEAIKDRGPKSNTFEATNHLAVEVLANGVAAKYPVYGGGYRFVGDYGGFTAGGPKMIERQRIRHEVRDDGYILSTITTREAWDALTGNSGRYLYGDGTQRDTAEFEFIEVERTVESYYEIASEARRVTVSSGLGGEILGVTDEPLGQYFPTATQRTDIEPDPSLYAGREDLLAAARAASPRETKPITYDVTSLGLETRYPRRVLREDFALSEDTADLARRAAARLSLHSALPCSFALPFNGLMRPGIRVHLTYEPHDFDNDVHVIAVDDEGGITRCQGRVYVV